MSAVENHPPVVSFAQRAEERAALLADEKAHLRAGDALAARRRRLPWVRIDKPYAFEGPDGPTDLPGLFAGRRQLIVYRFFYEPGVENWPEGGCSGCSMFTDNLGHPAHLNARDTTIALVSAAPQEDIRRYRRRMGWEELPWYTTQDDFSADFGVEEFFGLNVFIREDDDVFHTYYTTGRAVESIASVWNLLDITPLGRQEEWEDSPAGYPQGPPYAWWKLHDEYGGTT